MAQFFKEEIYIEKQASKAKNVFEELPEFDVENAQTFFDIEIGNKEDPFKISGRVIFEIFSKQVPKTAENFRTMCTGENKSELSYKETLFSKIVKESVIQGGDTGWGGGKYDDE